MWSHIDWFYYPCIPLFMIHFVFSDVYKARYTSCNTVVAAKVLRDNNKASHLFLAEASVMTSVLPFTYPSLFYYFSIWSTKPLHHINKTMWWLDK